MECRYSIFRHHENSQGVSHSVEANSMDVDDTFEQVVLLNEMIEKISLASKERGKYGCQVRADIDRLRSQQQGLIANLAKWAVSERLTASISDLPTHDPNTFIDYMCNLFESQRLIS
tara:strand:- start:9261 stop:9611 length:351 start_codon:yes stop_codon:yes gene_type:complete